MRAKDLLVEYYDNQSDSLGTATTGQTRRPRLTMRHLTRLRKAKDLERHEAREYSDFVKVMYGPSASSDDDDGMSF